MASAGSAEEWRRLTHMSLHRTKTSRVAVYLEASFSESEPPQVLECYADPEQAIELGIALQEAGKKCLRYLRRDE